MSSRRERPFSSSGRRRPERQQQQQPPPQGQRRRRRQHESPPPPRPPSSRAGGGVRGRQLRGRRGNDGAGSNSYNINKNNDKNKNKNNNNNNSGTRGGAASPLPPPPSIPMGCLRSADIIYELLERKTKIGRGSNCDVVLTTSKSISSAHAVVLFNGPLQQASLRDLNSTNGTFVNNVRVHNDVYPLESGDILRFGCDVQSYRFELGGDMPEYAPRRNGRKKKRQ